MWTKAKRWLTAGVPISNPIERSQTPMLQIALLTVFLLLVVISPLILEQPSLAQQRVDGRRMRGVGMPRGLRLGCTDACTWRAAIWIARRTPPRA
jgi:hypothetical protein